MDVCVKRVEGEGARNGCEGGERKSARNNEWGGRGRRGRAMDEEGARSDRNGKEYSEYIKREGQGECEECRGRGKGECRESMQEETKR
jgi:hypothetical protein